jgi:outer membrane protein insertion porin family
MKNKLNQLIFLIFLFFTTQSYSNPIDKINFIGVKNTSESFLSKKISFKPGDMFSDNTSNQIIQSLFETGLFSDISIFKNENSLDITLVENPTIKYFDFKLNSKSGFSSWIKGEKMLISSDILDDEVINNNLGSGEVFNQLKLDDFILLLESKYLESGYYNSKITQNISIDSQNRVGIEISITQGNRAKIDSFRITGNSKISEEDLLNLFKIGEANMAFINFFTNKDLFTENEFANGIDLLTNTYFDSGYMDFEILDVKTLLDDKKEKIQIEIIVSEGNQYKLGNITFKGSIEPFTLQELQESISMSKGDIFNRNLIIQDIQTLTDMFADKGYAFIKVNPVTSDNLNFINIDFDISVNKKVYINRIKISGNTRTQDEVIRREIGLSEGSLYSRTILKKSLLKLRRLGYFSDVQISTSEVNNAPDKINISFEVEETQTGSLSFSISHSNNYGISFGAGVQEKNIFGSGNTLNAELKVSESYNKISFYFMNPNFNDRGHNVSIGAFKSEINDDEIAKNSYEIDSKGVSFGYGVPLTDETRINGELVYSVNNIKCSDLFSGSGYESTQCATSKKDELKANLSWSKNTLDSFLYPTDGENSKLSTSISLPVGDYKYFNINGDYSRYSPITDTTTLKLVGNINLSKGYSGKQLPFYKRHFGGGSGSVRGFGNKTLGPVYPNGKAKGGELSILGSINLITPAFFFEDNEKMRMSAFIDSGNIFEKSSNIDLGDIRMSAGFGYAYLSPIGTIGAYISTPILKKTGDTIENFGFSFGTGF